VNGPAYIWTNAVRSADHIRGAARAVLYFLASVAQPDGRSWYSQAEIGEGSGCSDRTVRSVLDALADAGVVRIKDSIGDTLTITLVGEALTEPRVGRGFPPGWKKLPGGSEAASGQVGTYFRGERKLLPTKRTPRDQEENTEEIREETTAREPEPNPPEATDDRSPHHRQTSELAPSDPPRHHPSPTASPGGGADLRGGVPSPGRGGPARAPVAGDAGGGVDLAAEEAKRRAAEVLARIKAARQAQTQGETDARAMEGGGHDAEPSVGHQAEPDAAPRGQDGDGRAPAPTSPEAASVQVGAVVAVDQDDPCEPRLGVSDAALPAQREAPPRSGEALRDPGTSLACATWLPEGPDVGRDSGGEADRLAPAAPPPLVLSGDLAPVLRPDRRPEAVAAKGRAKRGAATVDHLAEGSAWLRCVEWWLIICPPSPDSARLPKPYTPNDSRGGGQLAKTIATVGADTIALRFEYLATAPTAERDRDWIRSEGLGLLSLAWQGGSKLLQRVDAAAAEWAEQGRPLQIARNGPSRASGARGRPMSARDHWSAWDADVAQLLGRGEVIDADPIPRALLGVAHG